MFESYNPNKLKHIPGQEGIVEDTEKAELMANEEASGREVAELFKSFVQDPEGTTVHEIPAYDAEIKKNFIELYKSGITPEYIVAASEIWAERQGDMYDFRKNIENLTEAEIQERLRDLKKLEFIMSLSLYRGNWFENRGIHKQTDTDSTVNRAVEKESYDEKIAELEDAWSEKKIQRALDEAGQNKDAA